MFVLGFCHLFYTSKPKIGCTATCITFKNSLYASRSDLMELLFIESASNHFTSAFNAIGNISIIMNLQLKQPINSNKTLKAQSSTFPGHKVQRANRSPNRSTWFHGFSVCTKIWSFLLRKCWGCLQKDSHLRCRSININLWILMLYSGIYYDSNIRHTAKLTAKR